MAVARNKAIEDKTRKYANCDMEKFRRRHGTQRLATRLVMAGMLAVPRLVIANKQAEP